MLNITKSKTIRVNCSAIKISCLENLNKTSVTRGIALLRALLCSPKRTTGENELGGLKKKGDIFRLSEIMDLNKIHKSILLMNGSA